MIEHVKSLSEQLVAIVSQISFDHLTISFSGGFDSSLLAFLIKKYNRNVKQINLIYAGLKDTHDFYCSQQSAKLLDLPLEHYILDKKIIFEYVDELKKLLQTDDLVEISYLLPLYVVVQKTLDKVVVTGQGADELFMGYHKFGENLESAQQLSQKLYTDLQKTVEIREYKIAERFDKVLIMPYLDDNLGQMVLPLDLKYKNDVKNVKIVLREVAKYLGLPEEIVNKKKKAAQYGSGVWKVMRNNGKYNNESEKCKT